MTAIRWYLHSPSDLGILLTVERVSDRRGYSMFAADRHEARRELPHLRRLVESIDAPLAPHKPLDPTEDLTQASFDRAMAEIAKLPNGGRLHPTEARFYVSAPATIEMSERDDPTRWDDEQP